jgi:3D (Asp-Asp-Asp) domain-containing protein
MKIPLKYLKFLRKIRAHIYVLDRAQNEVKKKFCALDLFILITTSVFIGIFLFLPGKIQKAEAEPNGFFTGNSLKSLAIFQENTLLPVTNPSNPEPKVIKTIKVFATGYSSTVDQTDSTPLITAAGTTVREGIVATNILSFGTKIKLPELYGEEIFVVEDRMNPEKGYHIDIWFPSREEALEFGAKITEVVILSN